MGGGESCGYIGLGILMNFGEFFLCGCGRVGKENQVRDFDAGIRFDEFQKLVI